MAKNLKKFVNPRFVRTVDPRASARVCSIAIARRLHGLVYLRRPRRRAAATLQAFFSRPRGLLPRRPRRGSAPRSPSSEVPKACGSSSTWRRRLGVTIRARARCRWGVSVARTRSMWRCEVFLDIRRCSDAASDMLALAVRSSSLAEYAGLEAGVEADLGEEARAGFAAGIAIHARGRLPRLLLPGRPVR